MTEQARRTVAERIEHRRSDEVHQCIRPGCAERARVAYYVERPITIAGRRFKTDEFVDLCPPHAHELFQAANDAVIAGFPDVTFFGPAIPGGSPYVGMFDDFDEVVPRTVNPLAQLWAAGLTPPS